MLVPWLGVDAACFEGEDSLRQAVATVAAAIGARCALTGESIVAGEAGAHTGLAVAVPLVAAFSPRMHVVRIDNGANPGEILQERWIRFYQLKREW